MLTFKVHKEVIGYAHKGDIVEADVLDEAVDLKSHMPLNVRFHGGAGTVRLPLGIVLAFAFPVTLVDGQWKRVA